LSHTTSFFIDGREFKAESDFTGVESFAIQSAIKSYQVQWDSSPKPFTKIQVLMTGTRNLLLIDENIVKLYPESIAGIPAERIFTAKATEEFKTLQGIIEVIQFLEDNRFTKAESLITVGGGIIQDVAAFVGATFKRGIRWIYFPTTLLSMCDSCIGAKSSINHNQAKNQLGLFSAPSQIIIHPDFLDTLHPREIISGLGEIIKLHITGGRAFLGNYQKHATVPSHIEKPSFKELILGSLFVKKAVIEVDEFDSSYRKALNYGHTIGHAVEVLSGFAIPHGQAIIIGMIVVNELSCRKALLSSSENEQLKKIMLDLLDMQLIKQFPTVGLPDLLKKDKKSTADHVNFAVLHSIGNFGFLSRKNDEGLLNDIQSIIYSLYCSKP
jgi:3-dehydroquinate synthase